MEHHGRWVDRVRGILRRRGVRRHRSGDGLEIVTATVAAGLGYLAAEFGLEAYPHPSHWGMAVAAGVLGFGSGWAWNIWNRRSM